MFVSLFCTCISTKNACFYHVIWNNISRTTNERSCSGHQGAIGLPSDISQTISDPYSVDWFRYKAALVVTMHYLSLGVKWMTSWMTSQMSSIEMAVRKPLWFCRRFECRLDSCYRKMHDEIHDILGERKSQHTKHTKTKFYCVSSVRKVIISHMLLVSIVSSPFDDLPPNIRQLGYTNKTFMSWIVSANNCCINASSSISKTRSSYLL